jgi:hypothetical protein
VEEAASEFAALSMTPTKEEELAGDREVTETLAESDSVIFKLKKNKERRNVHSCVLPHSRQDV